LFGKRIKTHRGRVWMGVPARRGAKLVTFLLTPARPSINLERRTRVNIIDKRKGTWRIVIESEDCPFLTYPRSDVACKILENKLDTGNTYCCFENCPLIMVTK
jgi:hypothetical protein